MVTAAWYRLEATRRTQRVSTREALWRWRMGAYDLVASHCMTIIQHKGVNETIRAATHSHTHRVELTVGQTHIAMPSAPAPQHGVHDAVPTHSAQIALALRTAACAQHETVGVQYDGVPALGWQATVVPRAGWRSKQPAGAPATFGAQAGAGQPCIDWRTGWWWQRCSGAGES